MSPLIFQTSANGGKMNEIFIDVIFRSWLSKFIGAYTVTPGIISQVSNRPGSVATRNSCVETLCRL